MAKNLTKTQNNQLNSENLNGDLTKKCRGCLIEEESMNFLFDEQGQKDEKGFCSLADILLRTTGTEIKQEEGFPTHLCQQCTCAVVDFYDFKTVLMNTEQHLNSIRNNKLLETKTELLEIQPDIVFDDTGTVKSESDTEKSPPKRCLRKASKNIKSWYKSEIVDDETHHPTKKKRSKKQKLQKQNLVQKVFVCEICGASFKTKENLGGHMETHSEERKYVCNFCNKAVKLKTSFTKHLKLHTNPRQIVCDVCGQRFNLRSHLDIHYKAKHLRIRDFKCTLCEKAFSMKKTLEQHIERHNPNRERKFACKYCSMTYMEKRHLVRHHKEKHDEIRFDCQLCEMSYTEKNDLEKHLKKCHPSPELIEKKA